MLFCFFSSLNESVIDEALVDEFDVMDDNDFAQSFLLSTPFFHYTNLDEPTLHGSSLSSAFLVELLVIHNDCTEP